MALVWLNGHFIEESSASVSLRDTGLLHAAGVFTTMRSYGGKVFRLPGHLQRLRDSCDALSIPLEYDDDTISQAVNELLDQNDLSSARLRLTVTRGQAQIDPVEGMQLQPTAFLTAAELEPYPLEYYQRGMTAVVVDQQKLNPYDIQAGHKTLNYFSRLSALRDANRRSAGEALWFNVHNYLQSGSVSNVFIVRQQTLLTPPTPQDLRDKTIAETVPYPRSAVLPGIIRAAVLELAATAGISAQISAITIENLLEADEVLITNSIMGVMPICRIERRAIGNDKPGPVTLRLSELFRQLVEGD